MKFIYLAAILIIVALGALFRIGYSDLIVFSMDESIIVNNILRRITENSFPPFISKSHGIYVVNACGIIWYTLMLFIRDPRWLTIISIGVPNTLAVILVYLFCNRFLNKRIALISAGLFSFSCWAILYSKNLWGVDTLQFFSVLIFYLLAASFYSGEKWLFVSTAFLTAFIFSLHLSSICILLSVIAVICIYYLRLKQRYFIYLLISLFVVISAFSVIKPINFSLKALFTSLQLIIKDSWFDGYLGVSPKFPILQDITGIFIRVLFIFGCLYTIKKMIQEWVFGRFSVYAIIGAWYIIFVTVFGLTKLTSHAHYYMVVLPVLFIICGIGFEAINKYISGSETPSYIELIILSAVFIFWNLPAAFLIIVAVLLLNKLRSFKCFVMYTFNSFMIFTLCFQAVSDFWLFNKIRAEGGVPGRPGMDLGSKISLVKYVIEDSKQRYRETGLRSYYTVIDDDWYEYLFAYQFPVSLTKEKIKSGFNYEIINDIMNTYEINKDDGYITHRRFGPKLLIIRKEGH